MLSLSAAESPIPELVSKPAAAPLASSVREGPRFLSPAHQGIGRLIPDLEFRPRTGSPFRIGAAKPSLATVIAFTSTSCPVTRRYAPSLAALERAYSPRGVRFLLVNPIATDSDQDIATAIQTHGLQGPYMRDTKSEIATALGARSTAEVFVLDSSRTLIYRGAIDDQYGLGYSLEQPRRQFLKNALESLTSQQPLEISATSAPGCALEGPSTAPTPVGNPTYHNRISRILQQNCTECHHDGGNAPFTLESYEAVVSHAAMIRKVVERGVMPPWFAAPTKPDHLWANDRSLVDSDRRDLLQWLGSSRPEGSSADAPIARKHPKDWEIGTPDAVFQIPEAITVKATGKMPYQDVFVDTELTEDRWVRALEVRPTARDVVHHVLVFVLPPEKGATNGAPRRRRGGGDAGNFFAVYVPGNNVLQYPQSFG